MMRIKPMFPGLMAAVAVFLAEVEDKIDDAEELCDEVDRRIRQSK